MNAHPHSVQLATEPEAPALPDAPRFAQNLMQAAKILVPVFEAGRSIDAAALRAAMEEAFGIEIPDEVAEKITTVQDAIDHVNKV